MNAPGSTSGPTLGYTAALYTDVAALLDYGVLVAPAPTICTRQDGVALFYEGQVNLIFGEPESGKTWLAHCAAVETMIKGGSVLIIDLDHNGPTATVSRLMALGAPASLLRNPYRFRYTEPDDQTQLLQIIVDAGQWQPTVAVVDSMGELMPLFGANSNSADDFTRVHSAVLKPLAKAGSAVLVVDHLAKNPVSNALGSTGTAAKKRAIGGISLRVTIVDAFTPGKGGKAHVTINKDRMGGLRAKSPSGDKEPLAATFTLSETDGELNWALYPAKDGERLPVVVVPVTDAELLTLRTLDPPPQSVAEVRTRVGWGTDKAARVLKQWRAEGSISAPVLAIPAYLNTPVQVQGTAADHE